MAQRVKNPTSVCEDVGLIPDMAQIWYGCGCGCGQQLQLPFNPYLAWELPYAAGVVQIKKKVGWGVCGGSTGISGFGFGFEF